jgi:tRNA-specific 2-thiouridylase
MKQAEDCSHSLLQSFSLCQNIHMQGTAANKSVIIGMSGGVDSSVAAYLLKEQGYEVEGVSLILFDSPSLKALGNGASCSNESATDAKMTAIALGIRHSHADVQDQFAQKVIKPFIDTYTEGLTPNPCIQCNRHIKFPSLIRAADERGFGFIATGHYARVLHTNMGPRLLRGVDHSKDQSYVLHYLSSDILSRLILPLGERTKPDVRAIARSLSLPASKRPESQEICFIEERNYVAFMDNLGKETQGQVVDIETGKVIGNHGGIHLYTIGQRKRLPATGKPVYVVKIDQLRNAVYIGPREMALTREFLVRDLNWLISPGKSDLRATVKVRSTMTDEPASIRILVDGTVSVVFDEPQWAPAPGQSAVFYQDDTVLGGGPIIPFWGSPADKSP